VSKASSTKRACPPAIADQEQRFLSALNDAASYQFEAATWLIIYDALDLPRLKLIEIKQEQHAENPKMVESPTTVNYQCAKLGSVTLGYLGPETVDIAVGQTEATLQRIPAASGTKYTSAEMMFWNHGSEALL
jgi:membrane-bound inhibitor of C-type lysozyme